MTNDEANYLVERLKVLCADLTELLNQVTEELDRIEQVDTPQTDRQRLEGKRWTDALTTEEKKCMLDALDFTDTPQTELTAKCLNCHNAKACKENHWDGCIYEPQTDCDTCKYGQDKHRYAHICNECGVGINSYTPQTERSR